MWIFLMSLICRSYHLIWVSVRLLLIHALGGVDVLLLTLYVLEVDRVLRGVDELWMSTDLSITICTPTHSLSLVYGNSLS